jgi:DNA-damage-inducible protein J
VQLLFHRFVADQAFPLELKVPNVEMWAMAEPQEIMRLGKSRLSSAENLIAVLDGESGE